MCRELRCRVQPLCRDALQPQRRSKTKLTLWWLNCDLAQISLLRNAICNMLLRNVQDQCKVTILGQRPGGPPSAPPFQQEILEAPAGSSIAGSYVTGPEQYSTSTAPREPSVR
jgi:hypothetical protein